MLIKGFDFFLLESDLHAESMIIGLIIKRERGRQTDRQTETDRNRGRDREASRDRDRD